MVWPLLSLPYLKTIYTRPDSLQLLGLSLLQRYELFCCLTTTTTTQSLVTIYTSSLVLSIVSSMPLSVALSILLSLTILILLETYLFPFYICLTTKLNVCFCYLHESGKFKLGVDKLANAHAISIMAYQSFCKNR